MPGQLILEAIRSLPSTGAKGFEGLISELLSHLSGRQFVLCKSGSQHGIDALADTIPASIECKRYGEHTPLNLRELEGELSAAARAYPRLELWVLACSVECSAQDREALRKTGENLGVATLILDASSASPELSGVPLISALLGVNPIKAMAVLSKTTAISLPEVQTEIETIKGIPGFQQWSSDFQKRLLECPMWSVAVRRHNAKLLEAIKGGSRAYLGTDFNQQKVITRTLHQDLDQWLQTNLQNNKESLAVVQGERYDGKTWCILSWLASQLQNISMPVFFIPSSIGMQTTGLYEHFLSETQHALGSYARHTECTLRRAMERSKTSEPWCLLVVDGLNEYPDSDRCIRNILEVLKSPTDRLRPALVLATVRTQSWRAIQQSIPVNIRTRVLTIAPYDDTEFQHALVLRGLPANYDERLPNTARTIIRRPRFLDLVVAHKAKLGDYAAITADVLYWLDSCDKLRNRSGAQTDFDVPAYQSLLKQLAARFSSSLSIKDEDIRATVRGFTSELRRALKELESEGVLSTDARGYRVNNDRLGLGMGLHLVDALLTAHQQQQPLQECLRDLLSPLQETDEMVMRLRTAAAIALVYDHPIPPAIIDLLVSEWLSSRNFADDDLQDFKSLRRLLLAPLLRMAPTTWSADKGNERLQELSLMVFIDALSWGRAQIAKAVISWFRMVPKRGSFFFQKIKEDKHEDPIALVREVMDDPLLADLGLTAWNDEGILKLHKAGIHLLGRDPSLAEPTDLLALIGAEVASFADVGAAEQLTFRRSLETVDVAWFQNQYLKLAPNHISSRRRKVFHRLIARSMRADLVDMVRDTAPPVDPILESLILSSGPMSPRTYDEVRNKEFLPDDNPARFAEQARELVKNPAVHSPCAQRLITIQLTLRNFFMSAPLFQGLSKDIQDHIFERVLPTIGAWCPSLGKEILDQQIQLLPNQEPPLRVLAEAIRQHAIILEDEPRHTLKRLASDSGTGTTEEKWIAAAFFLVVLPSMSGPERIEAILERKDSTFEWTKLYDLVAFMADPTLSVDLLRQLRIEGDPVRVKRLRYLLAQIGGYSLDNEDAHLLTEAIQHGGEDCYSALWLAARGGYYDLPSELLIPISTERGVKQEVASAYASLLLINSDSAKTVSYDHWPSRLAPCWRAEAAVRHPRFLQNVVKEIEHSLKPLLQSSLHAETDRSLLLPAQISVEPFDLRKASRYSISQSTCEQSLQLTSSESTTGGLAQTNISPSVIHERLSFNRNEAVRQMKELTDETITVMSQRSMEHNTCWSTTEFPIGFLFQLEREDPAQLSHWVRCLQGDSARARAFWGGLLHSLFIMFLRNGDTRAQHIWPMVYPFSRNNALHTATFSIEGVNSLLCYLCDPQSSESLSSTFLEELVLDVRTDRELYSIALGARLQSQTRLSRIAHKLLSDTDPEKRARGSRLGGWLHGSQTDLQKIKEEDPSIWVREVASLALESAIEESWAHHWFDQMLVRPDPHTRWGAAQLFIACIDKGSLIEARKRLEESNVGWQIKGEAWLLLDEAEQVSEKRYKALDEVFLRQQVRDLEAVCHPWRSTMDWGEIR